jgi:hypothetical protein
LRRFSFFRALGSLASSATLSCRIIQIDRVFYQRDGRSCRFDLGSDLTSCCAAREEAGSTQSPCSIACQRKASRGALGLFP